MFISRQSQQRQSRTAPAKHYLHAQPLAAHDHPGPAVDGLKACSWGRHHGWRSVNLVAEPHSEGGVFPAIRSGDVPDCVVWGLPENGNNVEYRRRDLICSSAGAYAESLPDDGGPPLQITRLVFAHPLPSETPINLTSPSSPLKLALIGDGHLDFCSEAKQRHTIAATVWRSMKCRRCRLIVATFAAACNSFNPAAPSELSPNLQFFQIGPSGRCLRPVTADPPTATGR